jgi:hypothetical protein
LYQINVQVPTSGLASGDNVYVEFLTDAADVNQIQIPYGSSAGVGAVRALVNVPRVSAMRSRRMKPRIHRVRGGVLNP